MDEQLNREACLESADLENLDNIFPPNEHIVFDHTSNSMSHTSLKRFKPYPSLGLRQTMRRFSGPIKPTSSLPCAVRPSEPVSSRLSDQHETYNLDCDTEQASGSLGDGLEECGPSLANCFTLEAAATNAHSASERSRVVKRPLGDSKPKTLWSENSLYQSDTCGQDKITHPRSLCTTDCVDRELETASAQSGCNATRNVMRDHMTDAAAVPSHSKSSECTNARRRLEGKINYDDETVAVQNNSPSNRSIGYNEDCGSPADVVTLYQSLHALSPLYRTPQDTGNWIQPGPLSENDRLEVFMAVTRRLEADRESLSQSFPFASDSKT